MRKKLVEMWWQIVLVLYLKSVKLHFPTTPAGFEAETPEKRYIRTIIGQIIYNMPFLFVTVFNNCLLENAMNKSNTYMYVALNSSLA